MKAQIEMRGLVSTCFPQDQGEKKYCSLDWRCAGSLLHQKKCGLGIIEALLTPFRRVKSTPDPDTFEKYRDTPPISVAILSPKYALLLADNCICTSNVYHNTPPICIAMLCRNIGVRGRWNTPNPLQFPTNSGNGSENCSPRIHFCMA